MIAQQGKILLYLDNAPSHPTIELSNVKLAFFPPNTTSKLQPLDVRIIQMTKTHYRKHMIRHILSEMEDSASATELAKKIDLFDAITWLHLAWESVPKETITKCFQNCGFTVDTPVINEQEDNIPEQYQEIADAPWNQFVNFDANLATHANEPNSSTSTKSDEEEEEECDQLKECSEQKSKIDPMDLS